MLSEEKQSSGKIEGRLPRDRIGVVAMRDTLSRLTRYWVYGGFLAGLLLLILLPQLAHYWSSALLVVFLQLPLYMFHQLEH